MLIVQDLFVHVAREVLKTRIYNEKKIIQVSDQLFQNLVIWATLNLNTNKKTLIRLLNTIMDYQADFFKVNGREVFESCPFGE